MSGFRTDDVDELDAFLDDGAESSFGGLALRSISPL